MKNQTDPKTENKEVDAEVAVDEAADAEILEDPIEEMKKEIESLQSQLAESKNDQLRAYADADNTRKRLLREAEQVKKYRFQSAALELLPILDNLNRALATKPDIPEVENFVRGFEDRKSVV